MYEYGWVIVYFFFNNQHILYETVSQWDDLKLRSHKLKVSIIGLFNLNQEFVLKIELWITSIFMGYFLVILDVGLIVIYYDYGNWFIDLILYDKVEI